MFRLWGKCIRNNHPVRDIAFDLAEPIWLESNIEEFRRLSRTRFHQDSFIETLDFDYMEIRVIEE